MIARTSHKRYANAKDYELIKGGKSLGLFKINEKKAEDEQKELQSFVEMTGADTIILRWTAREGFVNEEVVI